ncbi:uncharacterized protein [Aegilops tauschii subsp. strangulata]|uniref:uncharacterized protein isoform X3 n=1 Tax=Aegilops tauschii subsp. strangulata TaxID=200361 RepID=UPI003CC8C78F
MWEDDPFLLSSKPRQLQSFLFPGIFQCLLRRGIHLLPLVLIDVVVQVCVPWIGFSCSIFGHWHFLMQVCLQCLQK